MANGRWNPMQELSMIQEQMNRLLERGREQSAVEAPEEGPWLPPVDIFEDEAEVVVRMDVPGLDQDDIEVQIEDHTLVIRGERRAAEEGRARDFQRIERSHGPFCRTFALPATVDEAGTRASCDRGVLTVVLPKKGPPEPRLIEIRGE